MIVLVLFVGLINGPSKGTLIIHAGFERTVEETMQASFESPGRDEVRTAEDYPQVVIDIWIETDNDQEHVHSLWTQTRLPDGELIAETEWTEPEGSGGAGSLQIEDYVSCSVETLDLESKPTVESVLIESIGPLDAPDSSGFSRSSMNPEVWTKTDYDLVMDVIWADDLGDRTINWRYVATDEVVSIHDSLEYEVVDTMPPMSDRECD